MEQKLPPAGIFLILNNRLALGADDLQWILYLSSCSKTTGKLNWSPISFVSSTKAVLLRCIRETGVADSLALSKLASYPGTFKVWKASREPPQTPANSLPVDDKPSLKSPKVLRFFIDPHITVLAPTRFEGEIVGHWRLPIRDGARWALERGLASKWDTIETWRAGIAGGTDYILDRYLIIDAVAIHVPN